MSKVIDKRTKTLDEWDDSYARRLLPFLVLSVVLHIAIITIALGLGMLLTGGRGLEVLLFEPGSPGEIGSTQPLLAGFNAQERVKIFRIDFFREIVPWTPPEPEPVPEEILPEETVPEEVGPTPEKPEEPEIVEPEEPEEQIEVVEEQEEESAEPDEETVTEEAAGEESLEFLKPETEEEPDKPPRDTRPGFLRHPRNLLNPREESPGIPEETPDEPFTEQPRPLLAQPDFEEGGEEGESMSDAFAVFPEAASTEPQPPGDFEVRTFELPDWQFADMNNAEWVSDQFLGNYTIYLLGDISARHGEEDLLAWNYVLRRLITNPHAAYPPNVVTIASALENPYAYDDDRISEVLQQAYERESTFGVQIPDAEGEFAASLGYYELPQPIVVFVDNYGFIRMMLIGRMIDISNENISAAMGVIADMWQWTEEERNTLPMVVTLLINLLRDQALDPEVRSVPPTETELTIAPTWGYPCVGVEESTTTEDNSAEPTAEEPPPEEPE